MAYCQFCGETVGLVPWVRNGKPICQRCADLKKEATAVQGYHKKSTVHVILTFSVNHEAPCPVPLFVKAGLYLQAANVIVTNPHEYMWEILQVSGLDIIDAEFKAREVLKKDFKWAWVLHFLSPGKWGEV